MYCGEIMSRNSVPGGHAHLGQVEQQMARQAQAVVDLVGLIEMRIVDEALPADGGAGLFKVDAHDDAQVGGEFGDGAFEQAGVFARGFGVVDGAGAGEDEQAVVAAVEDGDDLAARVEDGGRGGFGERGALPQERPAGGRLSSIECECLQWDGTWDSFYSLITWNRRGSSKISFHFRAPQLL